ncbi:glycine--tRNA ligase subunit beta [Halalkalibacter urbisdiaboli]|uniref:glycine--tRNA ligase subunit beta n=1 Tax=Halalkalibacter urbisdiaboli TaxID=1960589 RepID=UPI000B437BFF|nr:glycine--tRNA ligase subunit beta [Halalkalibacter urbisdiaboli]
MSKHDFLLEIGVEELPARFVTDSMNQLESKVRDWLEVQRLTYDDIRSFSTPRRLAISIKGLSEKQPDVRDEAKGPAKKIAQDEDGNWTKAAQGFAKGQGVEPSDLFFKEIKGVEYVFANTFTAGKETKALLPQLEDIITSLHFPKNMRWNEYDLRFARPIQWLVALYGQDVIPFKITDVHTGNKSYGHRFLGDVVEFNEPAEYVKKLKEQFVIVDPVERKQTIKQQLKVMADKMSWVIPIDEDLLEEVTNLVEYPTALYGSFDQEFLEIPQEVLITSMREHQRYFPVQKEDGTLLPHFVTVRNGNDEHIDNVSRGNEKVLRARLSDADFFFAEDQKLEIKSALSQLENIVYHEELGSIGDKVRRIRETALTLGSVLNIDDQMKKEVERVAEICKFDLVTQMVYEFPELQGRMGEVYAQLKGEPDTVTIAIKEHYMPRFAGDTSPSTLTGTIVSIADKIDTIVTCFAIGLIPTGSQDPYALRRQAAGIVQMIVDHKLEIRLEGLFETSLNLAEKRQLLKRDRVEIEKELYEFFTLRLKNVLQEKGVRYDVVDAVLASSISHVPTVIQKAELLMEQVEEPAFKKVVEALSRVTNISKKVEQKEKINSALFEKDEEKHLYQTYEELEKTVKLSLENSKVTQAYQALVNMEPTINAYFDQIMVMADDEKVKKNRLAQMKALADVIHSFAHFQSIVFS